MLLFFQIHRSTFTERDACLRTQTMPSIALIDQMLWNHMLCSQIRKPLGLGGRIIWRRAIQRVTLVLRGNATS